MESLKSFLLEELRNVFPQGHELQQIVRALMQDAPSDLVASPSTSIVSWYKEAAARLRLGEPLQYVTGKSHFHGMVFEVGPDVLIPRPETEEMTDLAWKRIKPKSNLRILDIGTGSGCIAVTLGSKIKDAYVEAWDISMGALELASRNAASNKVDVTFRQCDALDQEIWALGGSWDLIISNPPYISASELEFMDASVRNFEPELALFGPTDEPLGFYKVFAQEGFKVLKEGGMLICECSEFSAADVLQLFKVFEWKEAELITDMQGKERFLMATC